MTKVEAIKSEIDRFARTLREGLKDPSSLIPSKLEAILFQVNERLFPALDNVNVTEVRKELVEDLECIEYAAAACLHALSYKPNQIERDALLTEAADMLQNVTNASINKLSQIVNEELGRVRKNLREAPELKSGNPQMYANDSLDAAVDAYLTKVGETMSSTDPNMEKTDESKPEFSAVDFGSDVANLVERMETLLDIQGTIARRALNYVSKTYGPDAAEDMKQVLGNNFDVEIESNRDQEADRDGNRPAAVGAGGTGGGAAAGGAAA